MGERKTLYYLWDYSEESVPCPPYLDAWANWLAAPDEDWGRAEAARHGATFRAFTLELEADIIATLTEDGWSYSRPPPADADFFAVRYGPGMGWDAERIGDTISAALEGDDSEIGDEVVLAVGRHVVGDRIIEFQIGADGAPVCIDRGAPA